MLEPVLRNPWVQAVALLAALVLVCMIAYFLSFVLVPLFMAFLVAYVLDPVVDYFERRRVPRGATIGVLAVMGIVLLITVPMLLVPYIVSQAETLGQAGTAQVSGPGDKDSVVARVNRWVNRKIDELPLERFCDVMGWEDPTAPPPEESPETIEGETPAGEDVAPDPATGDPNRADLDAPAETQDEPAPPDSGVPAETPEAPRDREFNARAAISAGISRYLEENAVEFFRTNAPGIGNVGRGAGSTIAQVFSSVGHGVVGTLVFLANFALFAFVAGYLLKDFDGVIASARGLVPRKHLPKTAEVVGKIDVQLRSFLRGQLTVCACLGVMYAIGLLIAGTPLGLLIAMFGMVASFVPYLGVVLTAGPALVLTLLKYGQIDWHVAAVVLTFVVAQALEGNVLTPKIVGSQVGLNPVWVILAILVFGNVLGFMGLLLAVPIAASLKVLVIEAVQRYKRSRVFESEGGGGPGSGDS